MYRRKEGGDIAPPILNFGTRFRTVMRFTVRPLYARNRAPANHRVGDLVDPVARLDVFEMWQIFRRCRKSNHDSWNVTVYRLGKK